MNDQRLRLDLTALADEVTSSTCGTGPCVRPAGSVSNGRWPRSAAALVLVAAAAGTAFAIRPDQSPGPVARRHPVGDRDADADAHARRRPPRRRHPRRPTQRRNGHEHPVVQFGKLFYGPASVSRVTTANLRSWRPGDNTARLLALPDSRSRAT